MSRTAKRPRGGNSENASTHMGLLGISLTMAASPDLTNLGLSSMDLPVRLSIFSLISANLQAMWAVCQSRTGEYPLEICPGWFNTITWAVKSETPVAGLFLESEATFPLLISLTETFLTLKPTLSPGTASGRDSWCISTDLTSVVTALGAKVTTMPGLMMPVSTRPTGTVPIPPILYTSCRGRRRGLSLGREGGRMESRASRRVMPLALPSFLSTFHPLYQDMFSEALIMLSPCHPEMGTKGTATGLYPTFLMKFWTSFWISSNLAWL